MNLLIGTLLNKQYSIFTAILIACFFIPSIGLGQFKVAYLNESNQKFAPTNLELDSTFSDTIQFSSYLQDLYQDRISEGYLAFSIDSITGDSLEKNVHVFQGNQYNWAKVSAGNVDEGLLSKIGYREKIYRDKPISQNQLNGLFKSIIEHLENHGYPFARIKLDSIEIENQEISAQLNLQKYQEIKIDTIEIKGNAKISYNYITNYLGIKKDDIYNESAFSNISTRIQELPFATEKLPSEAWFSDKTAKVIVVLEKKKANLFNGILGLQPNEETSEVVLTGEINLKLINALGSGEILQLEWRRLQDQTQSILAGANLPFIFNTSLGIDGKLEIFRQDTSFNTVKQYIGIPYYLKKGNYFKVFLENQSSSLIGDADNVSNLENADYSFLGYGIGYTGSFLDYKLNPRKGWNIETEASFGEKELGSSLHDRAQYQDIPLSSTQIKTQLKLATYIPIFKTSTIKTAINGGYIDNQQLAGNELFRIGGLKTLRGFDEASIFTSGYLIGTLEYRLLMERNSFIAAFADIAYYEKNSIAESLNDSPIGFGAGITFETKAGIFTLNYALGKQFDNPILLRNGKVHFGIVNYF